MTTRRRGRRKGHDGRDGRPKDVLVGLIFQMAYMAVQFDQEEDGGKETGPRRKKGKEDTVQASVVASNAFWLVGVMMTVTTTTAAVVVDPAIVGIFGNPTVIVGIIVEFERNGQNGQEQGDQYNAHVQSLLDLLQFVIRDAVLNHEPVQKGQRGIEKGRHHQGELNQKGLQGAGGCIAMSKGRRRIDRRVNRGHKGGQTQTEGKENVGDTGDHQGAQNGNARHGGGC